MAKTSNFLRALQEGGGPLAAVAGDGASDRLGPFLRRGLDPLPPQVCQRSRRMGTHASGMWADVYHCQSGLLRWAPKSADSQGGRWVRVHRGRHEGGVGLPEPSLGLSTAPHLPWGQGGFTCVSS